MSNIFFNIDILVVVVKNHFFFWFTWTGYLILALPGEVFNLKSLCWSQDEMLSVVGINDSSIQMAVDKIKSFYTNHKHTAIEIKCELEIGKFCVKRCSLGSSVKTTFTSSGCVLEGPYRLVKEGKTSISVSFYIIYPSIFN